MLTQEFHLGCRNYQLNQQHLVLFVLSYLLTKFVSKIHQLVLNWNTKIINKLYPYLKLKRYYKAFTWRKSPNRFNIQCAQISSPSWVNTFINSGVNCSVCIGFRNILITNALQCACNNKTIRILHVYIWAIKHIKKTHTYVYAY